MGNTKGAGQPPGGADSGRDGNAAHCSQPAVAKLLPPLVLVLVLALLEFETAQFTASPTAMLPSRGRVCH